ncbi:hypothetical protein HPB51_023915 [Rhipicephalus microplus]|uniref:CCHC-type domain-containing protein n=1 Tax=Rhipicephalus microplus TaxID=6941 RepID=A0A9J6DWN7_RHIMP|nr:hypothetical protein HPB51_023915 [Rhipicephalus microplus]
MQNIFVVSTPSATNAAAYSRVTEIVLTDHRHPVTGYLSPGGIKSRGVIRGVDTDFDNATLNRMLIQPCNSSLLGARRIKNTETRILIFNGLELPNYVYCGQVIYHCTLCKREIDTCRTCGQVGHRQDVCPTPSTKVCDHCGHLPTDNPHVCNQQVCALRGEANRTGDRECRHRYQLPYLVRHRRQRRRRRKQAQQQTPTPAPSLVPAKTTKPQGPPLGPRSPTSTDQPTWADRVACKGVEHAVYADDITIWRTGGSDEQIEVSLQEAVTAVQTFLKPTGLRLSASKSELLLLPPQYGRTKAKPTIHLSTMDGSVIPIVLSVRILGVTLQENGQNDLTSHISPRKLRQSFTSPEASLIDTQDSQKRAYYASFCPVLNASFGSPATEDYWSNHLRSPDRALQHQAVQKAQKVAGELRLLVPT